MDRILAPMEVADVVGVYEARVACDVLVVHKKLKRPFEEKQSV